MTIVEAVRARAPLFISPEVASCAGLSVQDLQQFIAGTQELSPEQLRALARRMQLTEDQ
jgi:hypothetical protein